MSRNLLILLSLAACTPLTPPGPPTPHSATAVNAPFGKTWEAVIDVFATRNIPVKTLDRSSGLIAAEEATVSPGDALRWADCGKAMGQAVPANRANYNVRVKGDSSSSTVQVNVLWRDTNYPNGMTMDCATTAVWETNIEQQIKATAESR